MSPPLIYNLFPLLVGPTTRWDEHVMRAREMGFDWIYLNPWHYPGFSGSLYAPKEFDRLNPLFLPPGADPRDLQPLRLALERMRQRGALPMMDLVVNHTSRDAPLATEHPDWYVRDERGELVSPFAVDPDDPSRRTVWGDLAEVDNRHSPDREALWDFWARLVRDALELGFAGFRCDAAYKVPAALWRRLIEEARAVDPEVVFFAETLGAPLEEVRALREAGFHYFFNSSKWWNFRERWALDQHEELRHIAPSIAFPESHDTERLARESGGSEAVQRQRYAFAAAFSAGVMMPIGYEFGFARNLHVVETRPSQWERRRWDLRAFVTRVNRYKRDLPLLHGEGVLRPVWGLEGEVIALERRASDAPDAERGWIVVNTSANRWHEVTLGGAGMEGVREAGRRVLRVCRDDAPAEGEAVPETLELKEAEVVYVV